MNNNELINIPSIFVNKFLIEGFKKTNFKIEDLSYDNIEKIRVSIFRDDITSIEEIQKQIRIVVKHLSKDLNKWDKRTKGIFYEHIPLCLEHSPIVYVTYDSSVED